MSNHLYRIRALVGFVVVDWDPVWVLPFGVLELVLVLLLLLPWLEGVSLAVASQTSSLPKPAAPPVFPLVRRLHSIQAHVGVRILDVPFEKMAFWLDEEVPLETFLPFH
jgi:hypothetical protein